jgi:hypothetical protein
LKSFLRLAGVAMMLVLMVVPAIHVVTGALFPMLTKLLPPFLALAFLAIIAICGQGQPAENHCQAEKQDQSKSVHTDLLAG